MIPSQHPTEDALLAYGMGAMAPGAALIVEVHLAFCTHCRTTLRMVDQLGGVLLEDLEPVPLAESTVERALAALDGLKLEPAPPAGQVTPGELIAKLRHGRWRPFTPGLEVADVEGSFESRETVCLLKGKAGSPIPRHTHENVERFVVLEGAFGVDDTIYWPGDFIQAEDDVTHTPFIPPEQDCLCLFALEGGLIICAPEANPSVD